MKIKISDLKANPFKKYINEGKLDENRVDILKESIDHGTLPEHFTVRKYNGTFQMTSGHHRLEALKQVKGSEYSVDVTLVDFSDEQMLVDMVRENITQRDTDFHDTAESIVLARAWKQSGANTVGNFVKHVNEIKIHEKTEKNPKGAGRPTEPDSYKSIAIFLSKNGKAVSHVTVKHHLDIYDKLSHDLYERVERKKHATDKYGSKDKEVIGITEAYEVANTTEDETEQHALIKAFEKSKEQYWNNQKGYLTQYKAAPDEVKQKVLSGDIDIADIEIAVENAEFTKHNPHFVFIPNFAGRLKTFSSDVSKLERQVSVFKAVFYSKQFKQKYQALKTKEQTKLRDVILDIQQRIKDCHDQVDFFMIKLSEEALMLEGKQ